MKVKYSSNNSGGHWWLDKKHWEALEKAGWDVQWKEFLGSPACYATKPNARDLRSAIAEWEEITGLYAAEPGCPCCGQPHYFTLYDDNGKNLEWGPSVSYDHEDDTY